MASFVCVICQETQRDDKALMAISCGHIFHDDCVKKWMVSQVQRQNAVGGPTCPSCRRSITNGFIIYPEVVHNSLNMKELYKTKEQIKKMSSDLKKACEKISLLLNVNKELKDKCVSLHHQKQELEKDLLKIRSDFVKEREESVKMKKEFKILKQFYTTVSNDTKNIVLPPEFQELCDNNNEVVITYAKILKRELDIKKHSLSEQSKVINGLQKENVTLKKEITDLKESKDLDRCVIETLRETSEKRNAESDCFPLMRKTGGNELKRKCGEELQTASHGESPSDACEGPSSSSDAAQASIPEGQSSIIGTKLKWKRLSANDWFGDKWKERETIKPPPPPPPPVWYDAAGNIIQGTDPRTSWSWIREPPSDPKVNAKNYAGLLKPCKLKVPSKRKKTENDQ